MELNPNLKAPSFGRSGIFPKAVGWLLTPVAQAPAKSSADPDPPPVAGLEGERGPSKTLLHRTPDLFIGFLKETCVVFFKKKERVRC